MRSAGRWPGCCRRSGKRRSSVGRRSEDVQRAAHRDRGRLLRHRGLVRRNARARLLRDGVQIWEGTFASLKRFKDDVREVQTGYECGIGLEGYNDVKIGDVIEPYEIEETPATLS